MKFWYLTLLFVGTSFAQVTANFNNRTGGTVIPSGFFGTNSTNLSAATPLNLLQPGGIGYLRLFISINQDCNSSGVCTWTGVPKSQLDLISAQGLKVLATMYQTSADIGASVCSVPSSASTWAAHVNSFLTYAAANYPGTVVAVEQRNEPDLVSSPDWCPTSGTNLSNYETFIGTAGPIIASAFPGILVGGPALGAPSTNAASWIPGVIGSWSGIGFISYHYYNSAQTSWANYLSVMQNVSTGIGATYATVQGLASTAGSAAPILVTEGNTDFAFAANCCRNDATFGPLWNVLNAVDYLNAIGTYGAATLPSQFFYFSDESSATPDFFCLFGTPSTTNCDTTTLSPYPQYYAYQMMGSLLNIERGGNLATSVSPGSTTGGLSATAFYILGADTIIVVNPTASPISSGTITFNNVGFISARGVSYLLNASNSTITVNSISLTSISGGYTMSSVSIPADSSMAFSAISLIPPTQFSGKVKMSGKFK